MLKKYPFVKQDGLKDCGVASLLMIIKHYNGNISKERLREMTKTSKHGTTAYNLIEAVRLIGFKAKGIKCNLEGLRKNNIILPCLAYVTIDEIYNHYVVIYKIDFKKQELLIADPSNKLLKMKMKDFEKIYNGVLIMMYPKKKIPVFDKEKSFYKYIIEIFLKNRKTLFLVVVLSLLITFFSILNSFYFQLTLSQINSPNLIFKIFMIFIVINVLKNVNVFLRNQLLVYINQKFSLDLFMDVFKKIILLPYNYYRNRTSGEIIARINDLNIIRQAINEIFLTLFIDVILTIFAAFILFFLNKLLFLFSLTFLFLYIIVVFILKPLIYKNLNIVKNDYTNMNSYIVENLTGFETVKGLGIEQNVIRNLKDKFIIYMKKTKKLELISNLEQVITSLIDGFVSIIVIYIGLVLTVKNRLNITELITFVFLLNYFLEPVKNMLNLVKIIEESKLSYKRIFEIINYKVEKKQDQNILFKELEIKKGNNLYNVSFLIKSDLKIQLGEKIALIGSSGSGKSTLLKLMKNYYETNNVLVNNQRLNTFSLNDINSNIVYISQNEILFSDTLYNNIVLNKEIEQERFYQVIKDCYIEDIIKNNHSNYYMLIEENGFNISGGEKQRIILARTLLMDANYILIDEGLSQVDVSLERKIIKNILHNYHHKTIIFVTHRTDNIDLFDRIIKMEKGKILNDITRNEGKGVI